MIKQFDESGIIPDMIGIMTLSHGPMASAILKSAAVISGEEVKNSAAFCLEADDDLMEYGKTVSAAIDAFPAGCLIFIDILGGTPYNQLVIQSRKKDKMPAALTGMSLPMIIVANMLRGSGMDGDTLIQAIMEECSTSVISVKERMESMKKE